MKMNKKDIIEYLRGNVTKIDATKDQGIVDIINYTLKGYDENPRNVSVEELKEVYNEAVASINGQTSLAVEAVVAVETSVKKSKLKKNTKKKETTEVKSTDELAADIIGDSEEDSEEETVDTEPKEVPKKETKKTSNKSNKSVTSTPKKDLATKEMFPQKLETSVGKLEKVMDIETFEDIQKLMDEGKTLVLAMYWSKRLLKQYDYDSLNIAGAPVTEFENDLDLYQPVYITENGNAAYFVSLYTEVMTTVIKKDLEVVDDMRFVNGAEFNFYTIISEE